MAFDAHTNFAYAPVATAPSPPTSGTSLTLAAGGGALFPTPPFNATVWPVGVLALAPVAEIVRVTVKVGDVLTLVRAREGSTARAIVPGDQCAATITAKTLQDVEGPVDDARLSANVALKTVDNGFVSQTFASPSYLTGPNSLLGLTDSLSPVNARCWRLVNYANGLLRVQALTDGFAALQADVLVLDRTGGVTILGDLSEKNRLTPMGHWIDVPFSAANFGATGGTWAVAAGNVARFSYMLVGKTMFVQLQIAGSTVTGAPSSLNLVLPYVILAGQTAPCYYYNAPNAGWGIYMQSSQDLYMRLFRDPFSTPFAAVADQAFWFSAAVQIL